MSADDTPIAPSGDVTRLVEIMAALRTPVTGCPWDLEQSFETIIPYTLEEAYEVADAIERGDRADLKEELGDLLLQVVYHSRLAEEEGAFHFPDVVHGVTTKMIRRHPHVFGDQRGASVEQAKTNWERIKAEERAEKAAERARMAAIASSSDPDTGPEPSRVLAGVPSALPALVRALKLQDKAAAVGFDWPSIAPVFDKVREEIGELEEAAVAADPRGQSQLDGTQGGRPAANLAAIEEELGDLLFVLANVARHLSLDAEAALRKANAKFTRRFAAIEAKLAARGSTPAQSDLSEMDALWDEVKREEKRTGRE